MSETPLKGLKKFNTIALTDKISKNVGQAATFRRTQRKTASVLANPESFLNTTAPTIDHNLSLPKIKTKRKQKKQGTFLQSWLDQALGSSDPFANQQQKQHLKDDFSILKTIRKYELDKRFLQSQNIPADKIQRLYQSLYIYSHGVNKVFEDLLEYIKQTENNDLLSNFWRAYTKLLQGSTSYQTVFQKVQKQHIQNIRGLKNSIETRTEMFAEERKQFERKIKQLQKIAQQKEAKLDNLKIQYNVLQSTLTLTDQAFNQQVNLRLKFEQKINAIYTTYEELKTKYTKIVEQMSIKNLDMIDRDNMQNQLKNKLLVERTKVDELMFLLKAQKDKTSQRQSELVIKNQQLQDARALLASKSNQQDTKHDTMQQHLSAMKAMKTKQIETANVIASQKITIRQQEQHVKKISQSLDEYKLHNNELYEKYAGSGKKIVGLQSNIEAMNIKISDLQNQVQSKSIQIADLNRQLSHTKGERDNLRNDLEVSVKNLKDTRDTMTKNNIILEDLKAVKDKYERINQILKDQLKQMQTAHNASTQQLSLKIQEFEGMKLLLDSRDKTIMQYQKSMEQQKQLNKGKITALNNTISKKQNLVLQYQKKKQQNEKEAGNLKSALKAAQDKNIIMESQRLKLQIQLSGKIKILTDLENILGLENKKYYELNQKLQGELKQKSDINSKLMTTQFVLKTKNEEERVQILSLGSLLSQYKNKLISRAQYIHPMVYEDALEIARRCSRNQVAAKQKLINYEKQIIIYIETNKKLQALAAQQKNKIQLYQQKMEKQAKQKVKNNEKLNKLQQSLRNTTLLYENEKDANKSNTEALDKKRKIQVQQKEKIKQLEALSTNLRIKNQQLTHQIGKMIKQRDTRKQIKKQVRNQQSQTEVQQEITLVNKQIEKMDQQAQTQVDYTQSRQMTTQLMRPIYEQIKETELSIKKQVVPQKKVQNKDFKKALKLTYMRR